MLRKVIKLYSYRLQVLQMLEVEGYYAQVKMCESLLYRLQNMPQVFENLWFSDESIFHLYGRVDQHSCLILEK